MQIQINVTYDDGRTDKLTAGPLQVVKFERWAKVGVGRAFAPIAEGGEGAKFEHLCWLAHSAAQTQAKANGEAVPPLDPWLETVVDIEMVTDDEAGPHPLESAG